MANDFWLFGLSETTDFDDDIGDVSGVFEKEDSEIQKAHSVLFLQDKGSMLANALQKALTDAGLNVIVVSPDVTSISKRIDEVGAAIMYVEPIFWKQGQALTYLKDMSLEKNILLFSIGTPEDLAMVNEYIPARLQTGSFKRPMDVKEVCGTIRKIMEETDFSEHKHILVVDDSGESLRAIKSWLEPKYTVSLSNSGTNAIKFLAHTKPDLILLDYEMPIITGKEVFTMIRGDVETADIPIIFLTSHNDRETVLEVMTQKPDGYLLKTMAPEAIVEAINSFFAIQKNSKLK